MEAPPSALIVTGGAGFIGSCFVLEALKRGAPRVITLDKLTYAGNPENLASVAADPRHVLVQGDIGDRALVDRLLAEHQPGAIVNFAAESHVDRSIDAPGEFVQTNVVGTFTLLESFRAYAASHAAARFLHVSTDEVYGSLGAEGLFSEETPYAPNSPYSASKAAADHLVRAYHHTYGVATLTTNCSNNYGPRQFPEKLVPLMILNALEGKPLPVYGDGKNVRDWLFVEDHCSAIFLALAKGVPGRTYCVGGRNERSNLELVHTLCNLLDEMAPSSRPRRELVTFVKDRPGHDRRYAIDPTRAETELGWKPRHDLSSGLRETVRWYLEHRGWCERIADGSYQRERQGLGAVS